MNETAASKIAYLLNKRGFIIDEDLSEHLKSGVNYKYFANWIISNQDLIRNEGYCGGSLVDWSTGFRGKGCAYGVTDEDAHIENDLIDRYCAITDSINHESFCIKELRFCLLDIDYECPCGRKSSVSPTKIPKKKDLVEVTSLNGKCLDCNRRSAPVAVSKPFKVVSS